MVLFSCPVTAQLICAFVFACAKSRFSHAWAHMLIIANTPLNKTSVFAIMSVSFSGMPICSNFLVHTANLGNLSQRFNVYAFRLFASFQNQIITLN